MADDDPCNICGGDIWLTMRDGGAVLPCRWCEDGRQAAAALVRDAKGETRGAVSAALTGYNEDDVVFQERGDPEVVSPERLAELRSATLAVAKDFRMP